MVLLTLALTSSWLRWLPVTTSMPRPPWAMNSVMSRLPESSVRAASLGADKCRMANRHKALLIHGVSPQARCCVLPSFARWTQ